MTASDNTAKRQQRGGGLGALSPAEVRVVPATTERWDDLVELFTRRGPRGGGGPGDAGCWCMWWRARSRDPDTNRAGLQALVRSDTKPGLLAYERDRPVGWISVAPRDSYGQLMRSRVYAPRKAEAGIWAIACIYVPPADRRRGCTQLLLEEAIEYAFAQGASALEAYPASPGKRPDYMGLFSKYLELGFNPIGEASTRTVMRLDRAGRRSPSI